MRIALKPVNGGLASIQVAATKVSGLSFLDTLAQASSSAANRSALTVTALRDSSSDTPDHGSEDQTSRLPVAASENEAVDAQEISTVGSMIRKSATVIAGEQNQNADPSRATLTIGGLASSAHSQPQSKASQPAEKQETDSSQQASQGVAQQPVVSMPAVSLSEVSFGRLMQFKAASPTASAELPTFPTAMRSNANSIAQAGSDGADASQSQVAPSASPAVTLSEVSFGRSLQYEAASPTASAELPAFPVVMKSNAKSTVQAGSDGADANQNPAPAAASPAVTPSEVSFSRSLQYEAGSPTASAELPAFPAVLRSNAKSTVQAGSDGADAGQSPVPPSASPAVTLPEISFGRSLQYEAASPTASAELPAIPAVLRSNAKSTEQAGSDGADAGQSTVSPSASPAVTLPEISFGRALQYEAASPTASAELPAFPAVLRSNASSIAQAGSDGTDASQSSAPPAASSAVTRSEVSFGRPLQYETASPIASAELPAFPALPRSNASSVAQAGSDGTDASQNPAPPNASLASTDPSLLSPAIAAALIEQSTFAVGSFLPQSMTLSKSDGTGTLTDKASQFKSGGATFAVNASDTSSSKASPAQDSISTDRSAQNGNPLPQHALGDSSAVTPLAIKPLEATVAQTVPVSNHTASVSSGQPHAALSATDVPMKAQDPADAAAERLERAGSAAAAGISTARLIQTMSESEMRVGMHSAEFGDISIRTSVSQQQLTAQISVDHSELGSAISAHLPSLESKLGSEFGLHASIDVNQLGGSATGGNGQSSHQNQKTTSQSVLLDSLAPNAESDRMPLPGQLLEVDGSRLDIRA